MRILIVNDQLDLAGGAEVYMWAVARGLRDNKHKVTMLGGKPLSENKAPKDTEGIEVLHAKGLEPAKMSEVLLNVEADIVYLQNIFDYQVVEYFFGRGPTVRFVHDHYTYCPGTAKYWFRKKQVCPVPFSPFCAVRAYTQKCASRHPIKIGQKLLSLPKLIRACSKLDKIVVASEYVKGQLELNGVLENKIEVNPLFGFPPDQLIGQTSRQPDVRERPVVLFVGRVFIEKGVEYLLRASRMISTPHQVRIIGDGWDLGRLKAMSVKLDLVHQVKFLGWQDRQVTREEFKKSRVVVIPSMWPEPFGLVGIEAMSFGKPVVAFDSGGISQWLRNGESGILVTPGDTEGLAEAVGDLLRDYELAEKMGRRGQEIAVAEFSLARHLKQLEGLFARVTTLTELIIKSADYVQKSSLS